MALVTVSVLDALIRDTLAPYTLDSSPRAFAARYQSEKTFSKLKGVGGDKANERALQKFLTNCLRVKNFKLQTGSAVNEPLLGQFLYRSRRFFDSIDPDCFSPRSLHQRGGVGPGASVAAHGTDFLRKLYYGPVSATSLDVLHSYLRGCVTNPLDLAAAKRSLEVFGSVIDPSSRISFVEKTVDESRTIATEPSVNMFFQLAIGDVIRERLQVYGFDKRSTPQQNRLSAFEGSAFGTFATIDLSSASDSISLELCKMALPGYLYELLCLFRCETGLLPDGRAIRLPMISTMGNGWTFYLMSALLYCAVHAVCDLAGDSGDIKACSVWGDDIIVPVKLYGETVRLLDLLGFVVNREKSFNEGPFRESCGYDFYKGHFVRPVFIRRIDTVDSLYVAANRLAEWGAFQRIDVTPVLKFLVDALPHRYLVPRWQGYASGLKVPSTLARHLKTRWGSWRYEHLEPCAKSYDVTDEPVRARSLPTSVNPDGVHVALLSGTLRSGRVTERSLRTLRWRRVRSVTPFWDNRYDCYQEKLDWVLCPGWDANAERLWEEAWEQVLGN